MGKPFNGERRDERVISLVTKPEKQIIADRAFAAGQTVSEYVRGMALRDAGAAS